LDLDEFVSKVKVTADGKEVEGLKYNVTKDNELVLNWDTIEVAINKDVQIAVSIAMDNLDEFGKVVRLTLKETGDLNATEKKTGARAIRSILEDYVMDVMYEIPKDDTIGKVIITADYIEGKGSPRILMRTYEPVQTAGGAY
jgi:ATP-dependent protease Clp ATPase subunit